MERVQDIRMESGYSPPRTEKSKGEEETHFGDIFSLKMREEERVEAHSAAGEVDSSTAGEKKKAKKKPADGVVAAEGQMVDFRPEPLQAVSGQLNVREKGTSEAASRKAGPRLAAQTGEAAKGKGAAGPAKMPAAEKTVTAALRGGFKIAFQGSKQASGSLPGSSPAGKTETGASLPNPEGIRELTVPSPGEAKSGGQDGNFSPAAWEPGKVASEEILNLLKMTGKHKTVSQADRLILPKGVVPENGLKNSSPSFSTGFNFRQGEQRTGLKQGKAAPGPSAHLSRQAGMLHFQGENFQQTIAQAAFSSTGQAAATTANAGLFATVTQVIQTYFRSRNGLESKTQFRIRSKEFGQLAIQFSKDGEGNRISIVVQSAALKDYVEKFVPMILEGLARQNIAVEDLAVEVGNFEQEAKEFTGDSPQNTPRSDTRLLADLSAGVPGVRSIRYFGYNTIELVI